MQKLIIQLNKRVHEHIFPYRSEDHSLTFTLILTLSNRHVYSSVAFDLWPVTQVNDLEPHGHLVSLDSVKQNLFRCLVV